MLKVKAPFTSTECETGTDYLRFLAPICLFHFAEETPRSSPAQLSVQHEPSVFGETRVCHGSDAERGTDGLN